jgi:hypothetical protein
MRPIERAAAALELIVDRPWARKGYEDLAECYQSAGMKEEAEVLKSLVLERFGAEHTHPYEGQLQDNKGLS